MVRRFHRETLSGYVNPVAFLQPAGLELLSEDGQLTVVPYDELKTVSFVKEFGVSEEERQAFQTRPKVAGLWLRLRFRDGDLMEGVLPNNLLLIEHHGFAIVPPDSYGNRQRVFVP